MNNKINFGRQDGVDLRDLLESRLSSINILIDANDKNYKQRFENVVEATKSALAAADRAVTKAESATEKRFEGVNEFRNTLSDQQRTFIPRQEVDLTFKNIASRIDDANRDIDKIRTEQGSFLPTASYELRHSELKSQIVDLKTTLAGMQGSKIGIGQGMGYIIGVIGVIGAVVAVIIKFA